MTTILNPLCMINLYKLNNRIRVQSPFYHWSVCNLINDKDTVLIVLHRRLGPFQHIQLSTAAMTEISFPNMIFCTLHDYFDARQE